MRADAIAMLSGTLGTYRRTNSLAAVRMLFFIFIIFVATSRVRLTAAEGL
jgi:hypothetical protein